MRILPVSRGIGLVLLAVLSGCAGVPRPLAAVPAPPAAWHEPLPHGGQVGALADWWGRFDDPALVKLVALAQSGSPTLDRAAARLAGARAALVDAASAGRPQVTGSASVIRERAAAPEGMATATTRSTGLDASWELDLFGKNRRERQAALARLDARLIGWHDARVSVAAEMADLYVQYRACELLAAAQERTLVSNADAERVTAAAVDAGFIGRADLSLATAATAAATVAVISQRSQCRWLTKSMVALSAADAGTVDAILGAGAATLPRPPGIAVPAVPAAVLAQRPDIAVAAQAVQAAQADLGAARADLYPSVSFNGTISLSASPGSPSATAWSFGPSLSLPILDGGRRRAAVDSAHAAHAVAVADLREAMQGAVREVEQRLVNLDSLNRQAGAAQVDATQRRQYRDAVEENWRAGGIDLLTLEQARRDALDAEIREVTVQRDAVGHWIGLYRALGGGWQPDSPGPQAPVTTSRQ